MLGMTEGSSEEPLDDYALMQRPVSQQDDEISFRYLWRLLIEEKKLFYIVSL